MKYHINFDEFDQYKKMFIEKIDSFGDEAYNIFKATRDVNWVGVGHDKTVEAIYKQITELGRIYESLQKYVDFFNSVTGEYFEGVNETKARFKEIDDFMKNLKF